MSDLIDRQAAIDKIREVYEYEFPTASGAFDEFVTVIIPNLLRNLSSAQPERRFDEWCTDCKEYDQEKHCCPRFNHVIRTTLQDAQRTGMWIWDDEGFHCSECWHHTYGNTGEVLSGDYKFCPNCGARMGVEE